MPCSRQTDGHCQGFQFQINCLSTENQRKPRGLYWTGKQSLRDRNGHLYPLASIWIVVLVGMNTYHAFLMYVIAYLPKNKLNKALLLILLKYRRICLSICLITNAPHCYPIIVQVRNFFAFLACSFNLQL